MDIFVKEISISDATTTQAPFLNITLEKVDRNDTAITIGWTSKSGQGQGSVQFYTVQYRANGEDEWNSITTISPNTTSQLVTGLQKNTTYEFRVLIVNDDGKTGDASPAFEIKTCGGNNSEN